MTKSSLKELQGFLKHSQGLFWPEMRIGDYGGTDNIGADIIREMLAEGGLKNYFMLDFDNGIDLRKPVKGKKYDLGLCMDLLEHTSNPFIVAKNIIDSLSPGALLFVTAPFVWELHGYPNDYWRFCPDGLKELFSDPSMDTIIVYTIQDTYDPKDVKAEPPIPPVTLPWTRVIGVFRKKINAKRTNLRRRNGNKVGADHKINKQASRTRSK